LIARKRKSERENTKEAKDSKSDHVGRVILAPPHHLPPMGHGVRLAPACGGPRLDRPPALSPSACRPAAAGGRRQEPGRSDVWDHAGRRHGGAPQRARGFGRVAFASLPIRCHPIGSINLVLRLYWYCMKYFSFLTAHFGFGHAFLRSCYWLLFVY
jgi:hypothetical protein